MLKVLKRVEVVDYRRDSVVLTPPAEDVLPAAVEGIHPVKDNNGALLDSQQ